MLKNELTSRERARLRGQAQIIEPVVMVGRAGITEGVVSALEAALTEHELVKVRFQDFKEDVKSLSEQLAEKTDSALVCTTGFTAVFYRENPEK